MLLAAAAVVFAICGAPATANERTARAAGTAGGGETLLSTSIRFRREFGLRSDARYVRRAVRGGAHGRFRHSYSVPLTAAEERELDRRIRVRNRLYLIKRYLRRHARGAFAGLYTDQRGGGIVYVGFTRSAGRHLRAMRAVFPYPERLRVFRATSSLRDLSRVRRAIVADAPSLRRHGIRVRGVYDRVSQNAVGVDIEHPTAAQIRHIRNLYGRAVRVRSVMRTGVLGRSSPRAHTATDSPSAPDVLDPFPPLWAGLGMDTDGTPPAQCTSGFQGYAGGAHYVLTGIGCGSLNDPVSYNGRPLGTIDSVVRTIRTVAARVTLPSEYRSSRLWLNGAPGTEKGRYILSQQPQYADEVGDPVCASSPYAGYECGTVLYKNYDFSCPDCFYGGPVELNPQTVTSLSRHAFLGGGADPVFFKNQAIGATTAYLVFGPGTGQGSPPAVVETLYSHIADVTADAGVSTYLGKSVWDELLEQYSPELHYDAQENYFADSAAEMTDNIHDNGDGTVAANALKDKDGNVIARAGGTPALNLGFLRSGSYPNGTTVSDTDYIDAVGDLLGDSRRMHADPAYANVVYGRVVKDQTGATGGLIWLQYWFFYYNNNPGNVPLAGNHEGDWEGVQYGLNPVTFAPEVALYNQHDHTEKCSWPQVEKNPVGHPTVYVAPGSHASYFRAGAYPSDVRPLYEIPKGDLWPPTLPRLEYIDYADPPWVKWPGGWGGDHAPTWPIVGGPISGVELAYPTSPQGPAAQKKWEPAIAFAADRPCSVALPRIAGRTRRPPTSLSRLRRLASPGSRPPIWAVVRKGNTARIRYRFERLAPRRVGRPYELWITVDPDGPKRLPLTYYRRVAGKSGRTTVPVGSARATIRLSVVSKRGERSETVSRRLP